MATLFVFLFVTQIAAQDDDRADTTLNLRESWLLELDPDERQAMLDRYLMILEASGR